MLSRFSANQKWAKKTYKPSIINLKSTKSFCTQILLESMNFMKMKKKFTFLWSTAKMENYSITLTQEDHFRIKKLQEFSNKFCQLWNTWNLKEFSTETSSVKTFFLIKTGMLNLLTLDLPPSNKTKISVELFVVLHLTLPLNFLQNQNIRLKQWTFGVWEWPFMPYFKGHYLLTEKSSKIRKRTL